MEQAIEQTQTQELTIGGWQAARLLGIGYAALNDWVAQGLLPIENPGPGKGRAREFRMVDLGRGCIIAALRAVHISPQTIRRAVAMLTDAREVAPDNTVQETTRLVIASGAIYWPQTEEALLDILRKERAPYVVVLPVAKMLAELDAKVEALCAD